MGGEELRPPTSFPGRSDLWDAREPRLELGAGIKSRVGGGWLEGGSLGGSVGDRGRVGEGRLQQALCCRAGDETWGLELEEPKQR